MANNFSKQSLNGPVRFVEYTKEELDDMIYAIRRLYVANIATNGELDGKAGKIVVARLNYEWYMDIESGKYYKKADSMKGKNKTVIDNLLPYEFACFNQLKSSNIPPQASLPAWCIVEMFEDCKAQATDVISK
jgi:hypothetical protein